METITQHDERKCYCPMLGHEIHFGYCRQPGCDTPCRKIFDCWFKVFDVREFLAAHYSAQTIEAMLAPPAPKTATLYELIQKAQRRAGSESDGPAG